MIFLIFVSKPLGLSPDLQSMEQIRRIMRPTDVPDTGQLHLLLYEPERNKMVLFRAATTNQWNAADLNKVWEKINTVPAERVEESKAEAEFRKEFKKYVQMIDAESVVCRWGVRSAGVKSKCFFWTNKYNKLKTAEYFCVQRNRL